MAHGIIPLPPKMALQLAERWKNGEGFPLSDHVCEFVQGNTVICVFGPENPTGHQKRDPRRASELRELMAKKDR